ncbi:MAG TPA: hypothetical protein VEH10_04735 [Thermoplasmata archaeon]|nr:hypothetical protein [Thermoplasmata archaeon]
MLVFLVQQFGLIALSSIVTSVIYFAVAAIVGGVIFGVPARSAARRKPTPAT